MLARWKLYAVVTVAFILALFQWRSVAVARAEAKLRAGWQAEADKTARRIEHAAQDAPDNDRDAADWLRNRNPRSK